MKSSPFFLLLHLTLLLSLLPFPPPHLFCLGVAELPKCLSSTAGSVLINIHIRAEQADFCAKCQAELMQGSREERRSGSRE